MSAASTGWHDFYTLIGAASATLIGAMFVVVSLGSGVLRPEGAAATRVFLTSTVAHLSAALFGCALAMVPSLDPLSLGILIGLGGLVGFVYSSRNLFSIRQHNVDRGDRIWYAALPFAGYAVMLAAAAGMPWRPPAGLDMLALALGLLLAAGIRNSWDMIVFLVGRTGRPN